MRSLKIQSKTNIKNVEAPKNNANPLKTKQNDQIFSNAQVPLKIKCKSLLIEICEIFTIKLSSKLNAQQKIDKWINENENEQETNILSKFRTNLLQVIQQFIQKSNVNRQSTPQKIIRIKSQDRIKLRLLKQNQSTIQQLIDTQQQKQQFTNEKILRQVRQQNKRLQKKLILVSSEFNQVKRQYQIRIQKYKRLINSTLSEIYAQVEAQQQYYERGNTKQRGDLYEGKTTYASDKYNLNRAREGRMQVPEIESNKFVTIPSIPILSSTKKLSEPKRQLSHRALAGHSRRQH